MHYEVAKTEGSEDDMEENQADVKVLKKRHANFTFRKRIQLTDQKCQLNKMMLLIRLRLVSGPLFVYVLLECIKVSKQILIIELETGKEAIIPRNLGLKHLPQTFQYYDSILETCRKNFSTDQKYFILNSRPLNLSRFDILKKPTQEIQPIFQEKCNQFYNTNFKEYRSKEERLAYLQ